MKYRLRIRSDARNDIRWARDWYDRQRPGLGSRFGEELGAAPCCEFCIRRVTLTSGNRKLEIRRPITMALTCPHPNPNISAAAKAIACVSDVM